jgi:hypothetical protein
MPMPTAQFPDATRERWGPGESELDLYLRDGAPDHDS